MESRYFFKILKPGRRPPVADCMPWPEIGIWTHIQKPNMCRTGWHLFTKGSACTAYFREGPFEVYIAEGKGEWYSWGGKIVFEQARLKWYLGDFPGCEDRCCKSTKYFGQNCLSFKKWLERRVELEVPT